jgi:hypothetical protein
LERNGRYRLAFAAFGTVFFGVGGVSGAAYRGHWLWRSLVARGLIGAMAYVVLQRCLNR